MSGLLLIKPLLYMCMIMQYPLRHATVYKTTEHVIVSQIMKHLEDLSENQFGFRSSIPMKPKYCTYYY